MDLTEKDYAHWLFNVPGIGNKSAEKLLCSGISCKEIYEMNSKKLSGLLTSRQVLSLERSRNAWDFEAEDKKLKDMGVSFISRIDPLFPEKLKDIPNAPFAVYVKGKLPNPGAPSVAIVGARMCSDYGRYMARQFGQGLALAGVQVISGMARGVDGIAQKAALLAGGDSYGILGCGVDVCYPPENKEIYDRLITNGGIISEYPPGTQPIANFFPIRNRIISAFADALVVVEARLRSGTQITVDTALEQGKEVFAIPGRVTDRLSDGCNFLISQGAGIALSVEDVLDRLNGIKHASSNNQLNDNIAAPGNADEVGYEDEDRKPTLDEEILGVIDLDPVSASYILDELYKKGIDISVTELLPILMDLTGSGKIVQNGAYFRKIA